MFSSQTITTFNFKAVFGSCFVLLKIILPLRTALPWYVSINLLHSRNSWVFSISKYFLLFIKFSNWSRDFFQLGWEQAWSGPNLEISEIHISIIWQSRRRRRSRLLRLIAPSNSPFLAFGISSFLLRPTIIDAKLHPPPTTAVSRRRRRFRIGIRIIFRPNLFPIFRALSVRTVVRPSLVPFSSSFLPLTNYSSLGAVSSAESRRRLFLRV